MSPRQFDTSVQSQFWIHERGAAFIRSWRRRHRKAVDGFSLCPHKRTGGFILKVRIPRDSIMETAASSELAVLRMHYGELPYRGDAVSAMRSQNAAHATRLTEGYSPDADRLTVLIGQWIVARQRSAFCRVAAPPDRPDPRT